MIAMPMHPCAAWNAMRRATLGQLALLHHEHEPRQHPLWPVFQASYSRAHSLYWRLQARRSRMTGAYAVVQHAVVDMPTQSTTPIQGTPT